MNGDGRWASGPNMSDFRIFSYTSKYARALQRLIPFSHLL